MFKKLIVALAALIAATAFAAVDVNKATKAELESIKGIGPTISALILNERKKSQFKDWNDFTTRVKGVGDASAKKFSDDGLTLNGTAFAGPTAGGAPITTKVAEGTKSAASKSASAVKGAGHAVAQDVREEKAAFKENVKEAQDKNAAKKAEAAASAPMKK